MKRSVCVFLFYMMTQTLGGCVSQQTSPHYPNASHPVGVLEVRASKIPVCFRQIHLPVMCAMEPDGNDGSGMFGWEINQSAARNEDVTRKTRNNELRSQQFIPDFTS